MVVVAIYIKQKKIKNKTENNFLLYSENKYSCGMLL